MDLRMLSESAFIIGAEPCLLTQIEGLYKGVGRTAHAWHEPYHLIDRDIVYWYNEFKKAFELPNKEKENNE